MTIVSPGWTSRRARLCRWTRVSGHSCTWSPLDLFVTWAYETSQASLEVVSANGPTLICPGWRMSPGRSRASAATSVSRTIGSARCDRRRPASGTEELVAITEVHRELGRAAGPQGERSGRPGCTHCPCDQVPVTNDVILDHHDIYRLLVPLVYYRGNCSLVGCQH